MSTNIPVLPVAGSTAVRVLASLVALVTYWLKSLVQARRHRREAKALAGLDRRMLADIGVTRADVSDAFSGPFWEDPTALLKERAIERRLYRSGVQPQADDFHRPPTDRPARQTI